MTTNAVPDRAQGVVAAQGFRAAGVAAGLAAGLARGEVPLATKELAVVGLVELRPIGDVTHVEEVHQPGHAARREVAA